MMDSGIQTILIEEFNFLKLDYDFKCVKTEIWVVRYESKSVFVNIHFDRNRSYELSCELGRKDDFRSSLTVPFGLSEIVRSKINSENDINSSFQVTNSKDYRRFAKELAKCLKQHSHELLLGAKSAFNVVADFRDKECEEYAIETNLSLMRGELDKAWQSKNYKKVIELLIPQKNNLEKSELMKLNYALKSVSPILD